MDFPEYKYVDTAFGAINKRNHIQEVAQIQLPDNPIDCYKTYFRFDSSYITHFKKNGRSISQYQGKCISDYIPIDIDRKNLDESLIICRDLIKYLQHDFDVTLDSLVIYFSGSKGFHIGIPISLLGDIEPSENLPLRFKKFVLSFGNWGFDTKIYDKARLWRFENSINSKSGLYKIRLWDRELLDLSIDEIKELAKKSRDNSDFPSYNETDACPLLTKIWKDTEAIITPKAKINFSHQKDKISFLDKGVSKGNRNNTTFDYAKKLKIKGYNQPDTVEKLIQWNHYLNSPPLSEKEVKRTIRSVFSFNISDSDSIGIRRLFRDDYLYKRFNSEQRDIFVQILSRINTKPNAWSWKGRLYWCEAGELICSNQSMADFCSKDVDKDAVRYTLDYLEREGYIIMQRLGGRDGKKVKFLGI
ncbi:primase C-terminal domain-containing protein [Candidatus Neomarinimicrobiota bacterium]